MVRSVPDDFAAITPDELRGVVDAGTLNRGIDYADDGYVEEIRLSSSFRTAEGIVAGSRRSSYTTVVRLEVTGRLATGLAVWSGTCSCPMSRNCKHCVAVTLVAGDLIQERMDELGAVPSAPSAQGPEVSAPAITWEQQVDDLLPELAPGPMPGEGSYRALALVLTPVEDRYSGHPRVRLNPLAQGTKGKWVRTGASWPDLQLGYPQYGRAPFDPPQLATLRELYATYPGARYYGQNVPIYVSDLIRGWELVARAEKAGVTLLTDDGRRPVRLHPEPADIEYVVDPPHGDQPARLMTRLSLPRDAQGTELGAVEARWLSTSGNAGGVVSGVGGVGAWWFDRPEEALVVVARQPLRAAQVKALQREPIVIPAADWGRFALTRLPALRREGEVVGLEDAPLPEIGPPRVHVQVEHLPGHRAAVRLGYAYEAEGWPPVGVPLAWSSEPIRDRVAERTALEAATPLLADAKALWTAAPGSPLRAQVELEGFEVVDLVALLEQWRDREEVLVSEQGTPTPYEEATEPPLIKVSTTDRGSSGGRDGDWFDLDVSVEVSGASVPLADLIEALALDEPRMLLDNGVWFNLDTPELRQLASVLAEARALQDKPSDGMRLSVLHAGLWEELVSLGVVEQQSERWASTVARLTDPSFDGPVPTPEKLDATLRPYQRDGYQWLCQLWDLGLGGILADDMGLGKTLQMLAMAVRAQEAGSLTEPLLIVAPTSVMATWASEAAKFAPTLSVATLGETRKRAGLPLADSIAGADVVITSYALLRIDEEAFRSVSWSALVLDEAQFVKNHRAKGYSAARRVQAARTFALTGTPLENSLMDLWSLLSLVAPGLYPRPDRFKELYQIPIEKQGSVEMLSTLRSRIRPLMLRRTKELVAGDLPPKQEQVLQVALASRHRTIYDKHLQRERQRILGLVDDLDGNRIAILRALTVLRQLSLDPGLVEEKYAGLASPAKIDLLVDHLIELAAEGHRALVFSQFTGFLKLVRERLTREGLELCYLDGRTRNRERVVADFRDGTAPVFLISLKAGGFGLTLTEADYVYVLDPWWNPAAEMQAIDRTHRIGQEKPVNVYRLVSKNTIEEKVVALQERKRELFKRVVDDGAVLSSVLTADDIRGLLQP